MIDQVSYHTHDGVNSAFIDKNANGTPNILVQADTPTATGILPQKAGDIYINTATSKVYISQNNTATSDWLILN